MEGKSYRDVLGQQNIQPRSGKHVEIDRFILYSLDVQVEEMDGRYEFYVRQIPGPEIIDSLNSRTPYKIGHRISSDKSYGSRKSGYGG